MDLIVFERKAFEEFATKIEQFILRVSNSPVVKGGRKKTTIGSTIRMFVRS